jgi:hypothetical protein
MISGVLVFDQQQNEAAARRVASEVADGYLSVDDVGGPGFELLNVSLAWRSLCADVASNRVASADDDFGGWVILGVLRWLDRMGSFAVSRGSAVADAVGELDHIEAATCLAVQQLDAEPVLADPHAALYRRVEAIVAAHGLGSADQERVRAARARLERLGCLMPHRGRLGLRDEIRFQMPEE